MIRIINGTYGYRNPVTNQVEAKTAKSEPFSIDTDRERALVDAGVAEYIGKDTDQNNDGQDDQRKGNHDTQQDDHIPKYSTKNTVAELTAIAEKLNIAVKEGATKKEIVAAIDAALTHGKNTNQDEHDGPDDDSQAPDLSAVMPE